jgi:hypothetical protein
MYIVKGVFMQGEEIKQADGAGVQTTGMIAARLGTSRDQIQYIIDTQKIEADARLGNYRAFGEQAIERIALIVRSRHANHRHGIEYRKARGVA